jgi:hypothetical protein
VGLEQGPVISSKLPIVPNPTFVASMKESKRKKQVSMPNSLVELTTQFPFMFEKTLLPRLLPLKQGAKKIFTPAEDDLLFQGLLRFGMSDCASIQHHCLPGRLRSQIYNRVQNVTKRSEAPNIIKEFSLLPFKPMNFYEKFVLKQVIYLGLIQGNPQVWQSV